MGGPGAGPPYALPGGALRPSGRVAISNQRLVRLEGEEVSFTWKDYAQVREPALLHTSWVTS